MPWSLELIQRFADRWDWCWLSGNAGLPWSLELIERFADRWNFGGLSHLDLPMWRLLRRQDIIELMEALPEQSLAAITQAHQRKDHSALPNEQTKPPEVSRTKDTPFDDNIQF